MNLCLVDRCNLSSPVVNCCYQQIREAQVQLSLTSVKGFFLYMSDTFNFLFLLLTG